MKIRDIISEQIALQTEIQKAGFNIVECGCCGSVLLHRTGQEKVKCYCGEMNLSDCPDLYYSGIENNNN